MRLTGFDLFGLVIGGVAVAFSGFVLCHSTGGGFAILAGGALALALPFGRTGDGSRAFEVLGWLAVVGLLAAGSGGFLLGVGVFDEPDVHWTSDAAAYDIDDNRSGVLVTGNVTNAGDATARRVTVTATLLDAEGDPLGSRSTGLAALPPGRTHLFYVRFESREAAVEFDDVTVRVDASK